MARRRWFARRAGTTTRFSRPTGGARVCATPCRNSAGPARQGARTDTASASVRGARAPEQDADFAGKRRLAGGPGLSATVGNAKLGRKARKMPCFS